MKRRNIILSLICACCLGSCNVTDFSENLNEPQTTSPQSLLANAEFASFTHNHILQAAISMRYMIQTADGSIFQTYDWGRGDFAEYNYLRNVQKMIEEAGDEPANQPYVAIGKIMRAHSFFMLACIYGDVPYSQALRGEDTSIDMQERFYPAYDSQKEVLTGILLELEEANEILKNAVGTVESDIVYSGDLSKWRKLANTYQLRILLMMSKKASTPNEPSPSRKKSRHCSKPKPRAGRSMPEKADAWQSTTRKRAMSLSSSGPAARCPFRIDGLSLVPMFPSILRQRISKVKAREPRLSPSSYLR